MMPAILRPHLAWWQRTQTKPPSLPPSAVGGVPLDWKPGDPECPDCGRQWTREDAPDAFFHVMLPMPCAEKPPAERRTAPRRNARSTSVVEDRLKPAAAGSTPATGHAFAEHGRDRRRKDRRAAA